MAALLDILKWLRLVAGRRAVYGLMVGGLALSFCAALVIGLFVHGELTFDRFLPGADRVWFVTAKYGPARQPLVVSDVTPAGVARWARSDLPGVAAAARLMPVDWPMTGPRRTVKEHYYWADSNIFAILRLPVLHGDLATALDAPDSVVLTRRMAIAYFGRDDVIGRVLTTQHGIKLHVTAVLKDIPANSHLDREIFASGLGSYAMLAVLDGNPDLEWPTSYTYLTLKPGVTPAAIQDRLLDLTRRRWQGPHNLPVGFTLVALPDLHFFQRGDGQTKPRGHLDSILALLAVAGAVVCLASINFAGLVLAERHERGDEMAIRVALGARRRHLIGQVLIEALWVNGAGLLVALAMAERLLPVLNARLDLGLTLWAHPLGLLLIVVPATALIAVLSGLYPAVVLSRPFSARRGHVLDRGSSIRWRGWVVAQLSLVIVLLIASHTMHRQWQFATRDAPGFDGDHVVMIRLGENLPANAAFLADIRRLDGVEATALSFGAPTTDYVRPGWISRPDDRLVAFTRNSVAPDFFTVYRVPILAGRNLSGTFLTPETPREILINLSAVHALGFAAPKDAVGREIAYETDRTLMRSRIVGVVPDIRFATVYEPAEPMIFDGFEKYFTHVNVRLKPGAKADTLARIDGLWQRQTAQGMPIDRRSYRDYLRLQYHELYQQMQVFDLVAGAAILLSTLGLTGLSVFMARHQVHEMAVRRALGATFGDILAERLARFVKPLAVANLIAWPAAWLALQGWLAAFADKVSPAVLSFAGAGLVCVILAVATVTAHAALSGHRRRIAPPRVL